MRAWLSILVLLLPGCADYAALQQQMDQTGMAWISCLHDAARALDDHSSDATAVAVAVANRCRSVQDTYSQALGRKHDMSGTDLLVFAAEMRPNGVRMATEVVLEERRKLTAPR